MVSPKFEKLCQPYPRVQQKENVMKKLTLSLALFLAVLGVSSQANSSQGQAKSAETAPSAETTEATATAQTPTAQDAPSDAQSAKQSPISPQVQKLIGLYPRLVARIQPRGRVCFDGEECDITISVMTAAVDGQARDGKTIYNGVCKTCHEAGLLGAPKYGDKGAWATRIAKGKDTLYHNAINGFNAMPAKGGADLSDEEVHNAVDYIIEGSS